ncbi:MAG: type IV pilus modification protein PilV [Pseudomonadales bacterium]|jgi:type IV pilus assembly protein PilV
MKKSHSGFSLLEVLVTLLLTTVGILGMVAMQGQAIKQTQDSVNRTHVVLLANDLIEIIRAHPSALEDDATDSPLFASLVSGTSDGCLEIEQSDLMVEQVACWAGKVRRYLPAVGPENFYACFSTSPGVCDENGAVVEVQLAWRGVGDECLDASADVDEDNSICTYRFRSQI